MKDIEIYSVPEDRRYWLIRSKGGSLYDHFITSGVIAISHLDEELEGTVTGRVNYNNDGLPDILMFPSFDKIINRAFPKTNKDASETSKRNQSETFAKDIEVGDWVITVTKGDTPRICVGVVKSEVYISNKILDSRRYPNRPEDTAFVRRDVAWGPEIPRHLLSSKINSSLRAQQTVVNLDPHLVDLHHNLFPMFIHDNRVYISINISRPKDIPLDAMTELFIEANKFNKTVTDAGVNAATVKASFFSEGLVWISAVVENSAEIMFTLSAGYVFLSSIINGNKLTGARPLHETITNIRKIPKAFTRVLDTSVPSQDTTLLRSEDKKDNLIKLSDHIKKEGVDENDKKD